jgi:alpha-D-ribose 1-methylphosphonate 5-triphosphate diphosphatase
VQPTVLTNARLVLPDAVVATGSLVIDEGRIVDLDERPSHVPGATDVDHAWVMPGFIDLHSDALELEVQPRPNCLLPLQVALHEFERKLLTCGVTTMYHALSLAASHDQRLRGMAMVGTVMDGIAGYQATGRCLVTHAVHLRFELSSVDAVGFTRDAVSEGRVQLLSFTDHTPGQGQFHDLEHYRRYLMEHRNMSEVEAERFLKEVQERPKVSPETLQHLADLAFDAGVPLASHDDDSVERLQWLRSWRGAICEFPVSLEVAAAAEAIGVSVVVGAPNLLNGGSTGGNLSAVEAIDAGVADVLVSDYYPASLLHAVFQLHRRGMPMDRAAAKVTRNPARAAGIDREVGALEIGKRADLLVVRDDQQMPSLESVMTSGRWVHHVLPSLVGRW